MSHHDLTYDRLLADYGEVVRRKSVRSLPATILRSGDGAGLDVLAHLATRGRGSWTTLRRQLLNGEEASLDPEWLPRLARTVALRGVRAPEPAAVPLARCLMENSEAWPYVSREQAATVAQLLHLDGGSRGALELALHKLPVPGNVVAAIRADEVNPHASGGASEVSGAGEVWAVRFAHAGQLARPPSVASGNGAAIDRFRFADGTTELTSRRPLISIIMPVYRPTDGFLQAVRSLLDQTWENLEIVVVDDGSGDEFTAWFDAARDLDPRVRIVRCAANGGAYAARNAGLLRAKGELVGFQDADDLSHPERLAVQASPLLEPGGPVASVSRAVLATEDLELVRLGYRPTAPNVSSLLFHADRVVNAIGFFDPVRRGADTEYMLRLQRAFGADALHESQATLALVRKGSASLSRDDFAPGWRHWSRHYYRMFYEDWHARTERRSGLFVGLDQRAPFPAPGRMTGQRSQQRRRYDVLFLGDWAQLGGPQYSMLNEIAALRRGGCSIAVAHVEPLRFMRPGRKALCEPLMTMVRDGQVDLVQWDDFVSVGLVVLRYPPILQFPPDDPPNWSTERLWIVANQTPTENDGSDLRYLPNLCDDAARSLFGLAPLWVPQGPHARQALAEWQDRIDLSVDDDLGIIDLDAWWKDPAPPSRQRIKRIGRHSRDTPIKFPATGEDLLRIYDHPRAEVRMLGAARTVRGMLGADRVPSSWELLPEGARPVQGFLAELDYYVYFDHPQISEAFGRCLLEAAASGCLVVAPHKFRAVFGEALQYASQDAVRDTVRRFHEDGARYLEAVTRSRAVLAERFSYASFRRLVEDDAGGRS